MKRQPVTQRYTARLNRALAGRVVPNHMSSDKKGRFQHRGGAACSDAAADAEDDFEAAEAGELTGEDGRAKIGRMAAGVGSEGEKRCREVHGCRNRGELTWLHGQG